MKYKVTESARETDRTGTETGRDTTGTGVTGGTPETTTTSGRTGSVFLLTAAPTGTRGPSSAGSEASSTRGSATATDAPTITTIITAAATKRTGAVSGGDAALRPGRSVPIEGGGGGRTAENHGGAAAGRGTAIRQKKRIPQSQKPPQSPWTRPLRPVAPRSDRLQTGGIRITGGRLIL